MYGELYLKAAYAYLYIRDFDRAKEAFEHAISCEPNNPVYYFYASITALRSDSVDKAFEWAIRAADLQPDEALYSQHVDVVKAAMLTRDAHAAYINGDIDTAVQKYQAALELDPLCEDTVHALQSLMNTK